MQKIRSSSLCLLIAVFLLSSAGCTQAGPVTSLPDASPSPSLPPSQPVPVVSPKAMFISNETLMAFVERAATYVKARGEEQALAEFNNPNGSFIKGELYIYAYGFNGTTLAHPVNPEAVGKIREGSVGVFVTEMGEVVRNGSGFYRFIYVNPQHDRALESKLGYGVKIDDDWWIGSGVYTGPVETDAEPSSAAP